MKTKGTFFEGYPLSDTKIFEKSYDKIRVKNMDRNIYIKKFDPIYINDSAMRISNYISIITNKMILMHNTCDSIKSIKDVIHWIQDEDYKDLAFSKSGETIYHSGAVNISDIEMITIETNCRFYNGKKDINELTIIYGCKDFFQTFKTKS